MSERGRASIVDGVPGWLRADEIVLKRTHLLAGALLLQGLVLLVAGIEWAGLSLSILRQIVVTAYLTFVPGILVLALLGIDRRRLATMAGYAVGLSLISIMLVGTIISFVYPVFGIVRPISTGPLLVTFTLVVVGLAAVIHRREVDFEMRVPVRKAFDFVPIFLLLFPPVSFLGTAFYVLEGNNIVLLVMLILISLIPIVVAVLDDRSRWLALAVWTSSLALVYHGRFGAGGGHQTAVLTIRNGRWLIETGAVLPNAILYPVYTIMNDVSLGLQWSGVNPFLVSFIPLILFEAFRRYLSDGRALIGACLFMFSFPFYTLYPGGGRVATPVLFLALLALVLSDIDLELLQTAILSLLFAAGIGVSHYGTAYIVVFAFISSAMYVRILKAYDYFRFGDHEAVAALRADGGSQNELHFLLRAPFVLYLTAFVVTWYMLTDNAAKFEPLPRKVAAQINGIIHTRATGSAAQAATKSYGGSESVAISRTLFLIIGVLIVIGITSAVLLRLQRRNTVFDDEYLALGGGFLGLLGASFLPGGDGFNIARVMMIVFTFAVPFAVLGAERPLKILGGAFGEVNQERARRVGMVGLSLLLCVFLLFNSGVMSELYFKDFGPSQTISEERLSESDEPQLRLRATSCVECNVETHVWVRSHAAPNSTIYADHRGVGQIDYYRSDLTEKLGYVPGKARYNSSMRSMTDGVEEGSYITLLTHNTETGVFLEGGRYEIYNLSEISPVLNRSSQVYHGGETEIYVVTE